MGSACGRRGCLQPIVSELEALTTEPGYFGTELLAPPESIAADLPKLGTSVAVTANTAAVMTRIGRYGSPQRAGSELVLEPDATCLRLQDRAIATLLAVDRLPASRMPCSLQFFDDEGAILHKAFLSDCRDDLAFSILTDRWSMKGRDCGRANRRPDGRAGRPDAGAAEQFDALFGDNGLSRRAALPGWGEAAAWQSSPEPAFEILALAAQVRMPLAMAVGNGGAVQVHQGALEEFRRSGPLVVLRGGTCTLSLQHQQIDEVWITRFESRGRPAYMLEFYDWRFHCAAQFAQPADANPGLFAYWERMLLSSPRLAALPCPP